MPITAIIGAQWGDEGKGKISSVFCQQANICARYQGGPNAGHCTLVNGVKYEFRTLPAGSITAGRTVIGNGVVVDLDKLLSEVNDLEIHIPQISERILVSLNAHVITPEHIESDKSELSKRIGTTGAGVGPAYADKIARKGIRISDLLKTNMRDLVPSGLHSSVQLFLDLFGDKCIDTSDYLRRALDRGEQVVAEGAQGTLLDVDHGDYPYVTSSNPTVGGILTGLGVGAKDLGKVYIVASAYMTKLGAGTFPTKIEGDTAAFLQKRGKEIDSARNLVRECGWLDTDLLQRAAAINRADGIVLTKLDVLSGLSEVQLRRSRNDGSHEYVKLQGWSEELSEIRQFQDLPTAARRFVNYVEEAICIPVIGLSVGPSIAAYISRVLPN